MKASGPEAHVRLVEEDLDLLWAAAILGGNEFEGLNGGDLSKSDGEKQLLICVTLDSDVRGNGAEKHTSQKVSSALKTLV